MRVAVCRNLSTGAIFYIEVTTKVRVRVRYTHLRVMLIRMFSFFFASFGARAAADTRAEKKKRMLAKS